AGPRLDGGAPRAGPDDQPGSVRHGRARLRPAHDRRRRPTDVRGEAGRPEPGPVTAAVVLGVRQLRSWRRAVGTATGIRAFCPHPDPPPCRGALPMTEQTADQSAPFADLARFMALPRLGGLTLAPDGSRLVTAVSQPGPDGKKYQSALWEIDPAGQREPRRLTRSGKGEARPMFAPDGSLLFTSARPDPAATEQDEDAAARLWLLPPGGEARVVATRPGGVGVVAVARGSGELAFLSDVTPGATSAEEDAAARKARKDAGVSGILHERYPVRFWDHD